MKLFLKPIKLLIVLFVMGCFLITVREVRAEEGVLFDGLSFRVGESKDLKYAKRQENMIIFCRGGDFTKLGIGNPIIFMGSNNNQKPIDDLAAFSKKIMKQMQNVIVNQIVEQKKIKVDGFEAYELVAKAQDSLIRMPMRIYQVIISKGKEYYLVQGMIPEADVQKYLPQFRQITQSILIDQN